MSGDRPYRDFLRAQFKAARALNDVSDIVDILTTATNHVPTADAGGPFVNEPAETLSAHNSAQ